MAGVRGTARSGLPALHQRSQRPIDRRVGRERGTDLGSQQGQVRAGPVSLQIFAADAPVKIEASYSGRRSSSASASALLIELPLHCEPDADDECAILWVGVRHDEQVPRGRVAERQETVLVLGMVGVGERSGRRVTKYDRLGEAGSLSVRLAPVRIRLLSEKGCQKLFHVHTDSSDVRLKYNSIHQGLTHTLSHLMYDTKLAKGLIGVDVSEHLLDQICDVLGGAARLFEGDEHHCIFLHMPPCG